MCVAALFPFQKQGALYSPGGERAHGALSDELIGHGREGGVNHASMT